MGIFIQDTDTGEERLIYENPEKYVWGYEEFQNPVISPDGKKIAFLGNGDSIYIDRLKREIWNVYCIDSDGANRIQLTHSIYGDTIERVAWRPSPSSVAVREGTGAAPMAVTLDPVYPNPFNPSTAITFTLPAAGRVNLAVYSITGQKVRDLVSGQFSTGRHTVAWDGRDGGGKPASSGIYLVRLEAGGKTAARKMTVVR
jgi:hypothetical protein